MIKLLLSVLIITLIYLSNVPKEYSYSISMICLLVYIVISILYFRSKALIGLLSFDFFFLIGLLLTCFFYPVFIYHQGIAMRAFDNINNNIINKASLLSLTGGISYMIGSLWRLKVALASQSRRRKTEFVPYENALIILLIFTILLVATFLSIGGLSWLSAYSDDSINKDLTNARTILDLFKIFFLVLSVFVFYKISKYKSQSFTIFLRNINKLYLFILLFVLLLLLIGGSRNVPIQLILIFLGLYNFLIKRVTRKEILLYFTIGLFFFTFVRIGRENSDKNNSIVKSGIANFKINHTSDLVSDLYGSSAPLYKLIEYADKKGSTYAINMILPVLSAIPFAQSFYLYIFEIDKTKSQQSSMVATDLIYNSFDSGAGTNIIGDLYYSFGKWGVIFFMFLLGSIISYFEISMFLTKNILSTLIYISFFSFSFFYARVEFFYGFRYIIWSVFLMRFFLIYRIENLFNRRQREMFSKYTGLSRLGKPIFHKKESKLSNRNIL